MRILGIALILMGIAGVAYGGINWTHRDKVVDLGPIEVTQEKHEAIPVPPIAGAVCLIVGATLIVTGRRAA